MTATSAAWQGLDGSGEARTWLLPLVRANVSGARLAFWASELLPLARLCGQRAAAAAESGPRRALEATQCRALELVRYGSCQGFSKSAKLAIHAIRAEGEDET